MCEMRAYSTVEGHSRKKRCIPALGRIHVGHSTRGGTSKGTGDEGAWKAYSTVISSRLIRATQQASLMLHAQLIPGPPRCPEPYVNPQVHEIGTTSAASKLEHNLQDEHVCGCQAGAARRR
jgi:hypothetical protein